MKKLIMILLLGIFLFSFVSAEIVNPDQTYDQIKGWEKNIKYDSKNELIKVRKTNVFLDDDIADYWLKKNDCSKDLRECSARGETDFKMQGTLFDNLTFYKIMEEEKTAGRVRWYNVYINTEGQNGTYWDWECINNSLNCTYKEFSYPLPDWSLYNGELFEAGSFIKWKIEAGKSPHHTIDWIAIVFGDVALTPWALWFGDGGETYQNVTLNSPEDNYISLDSEIDFSCYATNNETAIETIFLDFYENNSWVSFKNQSAGSIDLLFEHLPQLIGGPGDANFIIVKTFDNINAHIDKISFQLWGESYIKPYTYVKFTYNDSSTNVTTTSNSYAGSSSVSTGDIFKDNPYKEKEVVKIDFYASYKTSSSRKGGNRELKIYGPIYSSVYFANFTENLTEEKIWRCSACDTDGDCGTAQENRTIKLDKPNISVISPTGTFNVKTFNVWANITALGDLDYCSFNITQGAGLEVANTEILNCNESIEVNVSAYADYSVNFYANTTTGFETTLTSPFSVNFVQSIVASVSGGGVGTRIIQEILKDDNPAICQDFRQSLFNSWGNMQEQGKSQSLIFKFINSLMDYVFCKSASSIYPM